MTAAFYYRATNDMVDCRDHIVHDYCGQEAADWARAYQAAKFETPNQDLSCRVSEESAVGRNGE